MILDQKQKQFWNRHAKRNKNPKDPNVSVVLGAFVSRSSDYHSETDHRLTIYTNGMIFWLICSFLSTGYSRLETMLSLEPTEQCTLIQILAKLGQCEQCEQFQQCQQCQQVHFEYLRIERSATAQHEDQKLPQDDQLSTLLHLHAGNKLTHSSPIVLARR